MFLDKYDVMNICSEKIEGRFGRHTQYSIDANFEYSKKLEIVLWELQKRYLLLMEHLKLDVINCPCAEGCKKLIVVSTAKGKQS